MVLVECVLWGRARRFWLQFKKVLLKCAAVLTATATCGARARQAAPVPPPQQHVASIGAGTNIIQVLQTLGS